MTDLLAAAALDSFYATASREYDRAVEHEGLVERRLRFADRTVRLLFAGVRMADALLGALAERTDNSNADAHATVALWEADACPGGSAPFPWRWEDVAPGGLVRGPDSDGVVAVHETCSGALTLIHSAGLPILHRVPNSATVPWWERAAPLRPSLFWALGGESQHLVHAGAVGDDRGGVLLVGARGSGKTTAALAAMNRGLSLVADDYLLLNAGTPLEAVSLYNTASVADGPDTGSAAGTSAVGKAAVGNVAQEKTVLDLRALAPGSLRESLPVRAVVVPRVRGGQAQVRRLSPAAALRAWAPSTVFQMPFDDGAVVASLAAVVRRVPCFALDVGDDEAELAAALVEVLERAAP